MSKTQRKKTVKNKNSNVSINSTKQIFRQPLVIAGFILIFGLIGYFLLRGSHAQSTVLYNDIDKYCEFHVLGSLYGDGAGNGPPNGAAWKVPNANWTYKPSETGQANRFEYCAQLMAQKNGGRVTRTNNVVELRNFPLNLPFNELPPNLLAQSDPRAYRAFLTSVVEGEGNAAGKIDDNFKCLDNGTVCNPVYAHHVISLKTAVQRAGMDAYFVKGDGNGCSTGVVDDAKVQLLADNDPLNDPQTGGLSVCLVTSNIDTFASLPHAACTNRVPGGITKCGQLMYDSTPPATPTNFRIVELTRTSVKLAWNGVQDQSGIKRYRLRRDGAFYAGVDPSATSYQDLSVTPGATYKYQVSATDNNGNQSAFSSPVTVTIPIN